MTEAQGNEKVGHSASNTNHIYIHDPEHSWIPAQVVDRSGSNFDLSIPRYRNEQSITCDGGRAALRFEKRTIHRESTQLYLQNVDTEGRLNVVEDMVDLPFLHEVSRCCLQSQPLPAQLALPPLSFLTIASFLGCHPVQSEGTPRTVSSLH